MKKICYFLFLSLINLNALAEDAKAISTEDIERRCLSPNYPENQVHASGWVNALLSRLLAQGGVKLSYDHGSSEVASTHQLKDRDNYRKCSIELSKLNALVSLKEDHASSEKSKLRVAIVDELGSNQEVRQIEENLTLTIDGKQYHLLISERNKTDAVLAELDNHDKPHNYLIEGYTVERSIKYGYVNTKNIPVKCQGSIDLANGDILQFEQSNTNGESQVCLIKKKSI